MKILVVDRRPQARCVCALFPGNGNVLLWKLVQLRPTTGLQNYLSCHNEQFMQDSFENPPVDSVRLNVFTVVTIVLLFSTLFSAFIDVFF